MAAGTLPAMRALLLLLLCLPGLPVAAQPAAPADPADGLDSLRLVLGASLRHGPVYFGQRRTQWGLKPMAALRWGWLRLSNSGTGGLIGEANAGGASADLYTSPDWRLRAGLRLDRGRHLDAGDGPLLAELPPVRGTLRARLSLSRRLGRDASWSLSTAPDLLGRGGGSVLQLGYYQRLPRLDAAGGIGGEWSLGASLSGGDDRYMQSYFGVPAGLRLPAHEAEGGLRDASLSLNWQRGYGERQEWLLLAGVSLQQLLGPAARSPLVERRATLSANLGLAWRY